MLLQLKTIDLKTKLSHSGFTFRPRWTKTKSGYYGLYFYPEISRSAAKRIRTEINAWPWKYWCQKEITDIRKYSQSRLKGWMNYYGLFGTKAIRNILFHLDCRISRWAKMKYKTLRTLRQAADRVNRARANNPHWFAHWQHSETYSVGQEEPYDARVSRTVL